ncbi:MAG: hypothetical protein JWN14_1681 [Chthonomonadales bacterium]|nr:hypothetical protein [Chthonomonadales bacterium]
MHPCNRSASRALFLLPLSVFFALALTGKKAEAQVNIIYDTFGPGLTTGPSAQGIGNDPSIGLYQAIAQAFSTPGGPTLTLDKIYVPLHAEGSGGPGPTTYPATLSLYASALGPLGGPDLFLTTLPDRTLVSGGIPTQESIYSYAPVGRILLAPDTQYWIVADVPPIAGSFMRMKSGN